MKSGMRADRVEQAAEEGEQHDREARDLGGVLAGHEVADHETEGREDRAREDPGGKARRDPLERRQLDAADRAGDVGRDDRQEAHRHAGDHLDDDVDERVQGGEAQLPAPAQRPFDADGRAGLRRRHHRAVHRHRHHDVGRDRGAALRDRRRGELLRRAAAAR